MSTRTLADIMYPKTPEAAPRRPPGYLTGGSLDEPETEPTPTEAARPAARRSDAELGEALYPAHGDELGQFARVTDEDDGQGGRKITDVIRSTDGLKLHEAIYHGDRASLAAFNNNALAHAGLAGTDFGSRSLPQSRLAQADLRRTTFHGSLSASDLQGADLRGAALAGCSFVGSDMRDVEVDEKTDVSGCDFTGAKVDASALRRCKGWRTARGLRPGR